MSTTFPCSEDYRHSSTCNADALFAVLADFGGFDRWALGGTVAMRLTDATGAPIPAAEALAPGTVRHLELPDGPVAERLTLIDRVERRLAYELVAGEPLGMARYAAEVVVRRTPTGCELCWSGLYDAASPADVVEPLQRAWASMSEAAAAAASQVSTK